MASEKVLSAIERARMVAAKLTQSAPQHQQQQQQAFHMPQKRSADDSYDDDGSNKKFANISDVVGAQLAAFKAQGQGVIEEIKVPDKYIGLVIGKGGEQMVRIQNETGCKLQIAAEMRGMPDRVCTLMGSRETIDNAKRVISDIVRRAMSNSGDGLETFETVVPGSKCGSFIGRGGENIKRLSEDLDVKLVVVQEPNTPLNADKPLRIIGDPEKVRHAKEVILEILNSRETRDDNERGRGRDGDRRGGGGGGGKYGTNEYGSRSERGFGGDDRRTDGNHAFIRIPSSKGGVVIGRGGETIKDVMRRSSTHIEVDRNHPNIDPNKDKVFVIRGSDDQILFAEQLIYEKLTGVVGATVPDGYFGPEAIYSTSTASSTWSAASQWQQTWQQEQQQNEDSNSNPGGYDPAAWAAYYASYYAAAAQASQAAGVATTTQTTTTTQAAATTQPSVNSQTGQPDYSQAWVDYYKSMGMHAEAEAIMKQTQSQQQQQQQQQNGAAPSSTAAASSNGTASAVDPNTAAAAQQAASWQQYAAAYAAQYGAYAAQTQGQQQ